MKMINLRKGFGLSGFVRVTFIALVIDIENSSISKTKRIVPAVRTQADNGSMLCALCMLVGDRHLFYRHRVFVSPAFLPHINILKIVI